MRHRQFFVLYAEQQVNKLLVWRVAYSEGRLIVCRRAWKVFKTFCLLCYKQVIALSLFSKYPNSTRPYAITYTNYL